MQNIIIFREFGFNAAHKLENPNWTKKKNRVVFGLCNNANFHGHNYRLVVGVKSFINPDTGFALNLKLLDRVVKNNILKRFDHKNLNMDIIEFRKLNPTVENLALIIWRILSLKIRIHSKLKIILFETDKISAEISGE